MLDNNLDNGEQDVAGNEYYKGQDADRKWPQYFLKDVSINYFHVSMCPDWWWKLIVPSPVSILLPTATYSCLGRITMRGAAL